MKRIFFYFTQCHWFRNIHELFRCSLFILFSLANLWNTFVLLSLQLFSHTAILSPFYKKTTIENIRLSLSFHVQISALFFDLDGLCHKYYCSGDIVANYYYLHVLWILHWRPLEQLTLLNICITNLESCSALPRLLWQFLRHAQGYFSICYLPALLFLN